MTTDRDANDALDILLALPETTPVRWSGKTFWLDKTQSALLRNLGISFAKHHIKKWIPDDEWGIN